MQIEIDQSGKIEQTSLDTVIALTNSISYTLLFKKKDKRQLEKYCRKFRLRKIYSVIVFANLISLTIKKSKVKKSILIDTEYIGYNNFIKKIIQNKLGKDCPTIKFGYVGKESKSDDLARKVAKSKIKPNHTTNSEEIFRLSFTNKKSGDI